MSTGIYVNWQVNGGDERLEWEFGGSLSSNSVGHYDCDSREHLRSLHVHDAARLAALATDHRPPTWCCKITSTVPVDGACGAGLGRRCPWTAPGAPFRPAHGRAQQVTRGSQPFACDPREAREGRQIYHFGKNSNVRPKPPWAAPGPRTLLVPHS